MSTGRLPLQQTVRHSPTGLAVTRSMATVRAALPFLRALLLAGLVIILIMIGFPAILAISAATP